MTKPEESAEEGSKEHYMNPLEVAELINKAEKRGFEAGRESMKKELLGDGKVVVPKELVGWVEEFRSELEEYVKLKICIQAEPQWLLDELNIIYPKEESK